MTEDLEIEIDLSAYPFERQAIDKIAENPWVKNQWPLVYFIENPEENIAYVGESTNAFSRINNHLGNNKRSILKKITLIGCDRFNKSATLDIESMLIQYITSDGKYKLQNGNLGLQHHNYYQKDIYKDLFKVIWSKLTDAKIVQKTIPEIENSNLFKYSPYKSLNTDQHDSILSIIDILLNEYAISIFVRGSAGTGKTILATYLMKLLTSEGVESDEIDELEGLYLKEVELVRAFRQKFGQPKIALVVPMTSLRKTLREVFKATDGLKPSMVIGPSDVFKEQYDILLVDEAHRLRQRKNITNYRSHDDNNGKLGLGDDGTELDWIMRRSRYQIFFYDPAQSIKPSDVDKSAFEKLIPYSKTIALKSQMRVQGGSDYIGFVDKLLHCRLYASDGPFKPEKYELKLFHSFRDLWAALQIKEKEYGLCRLIAGYSWEWRSRSNPQIHDIELEGLRFFWNRAEKDWINSEGSFNEIGCIHTTQGYDLNYTGIIFGHEITYNPELGRIEIIPENYFDIKGKMGIQDYEVLKDYIINIYKTMMYRGIRGTYVYACDPNLRAYLAKHLQNDFAQNNQIDHKAQSGIKQLQDHEAQPYVNCVPLYDIKAAAGRFSEDQIQEHTDWVQLPPPYQHNTDYFVCQVTGDSMNRKIPNGAYCLFRKDTGGSREGKIVLVQHADIPDLEYSAEYAVKQYESQKYIDESGWRHTRIRLKPMSYDPGYQDIILSPEFEDEVRVIGVFVDVLV